MIRYAVEGSVARITMDAPATRNALSLSMLVALDDAFAKAESDAGVACVVLRSSAATFCAGHDLRELAAADDAARARVFDACGRLMARVRACPPVIASVNGAAYAAGCELVATCDLAVAASAATFATPGVKIGLFCHTPAVAVARALGHPRRAAKLLYTGDPISAEDARGLGLVDDVVAGDADAAADALALRVAAGSPAASRHGKRVLAAMDSESGALERDYGRARAAMVSGLRHDDAAEGLAAFLEKRPAAFTGA